MCVLSAYRASDLDYFSVVILKGNVVMKVCPIPECQNKTWATLIKSPNITLPIDRQI